MAGLVWGCFNLWDSHLRYRLTRQIYSPAANKFRQFNPGDEPDKFYVRCMVNKPLHLEWMVLPPKDAQCIGVTQGYNYHGYSTIGTKKAFTSRLAVKVGPDHAYYSFENAGGGSSGGMNPALARFLEQNWDALEIDIAGENETVEFELGSIFELFRLRIPDVLLAEPPPELPPHLVEALKFPLLICIGPDRGNEWKDLSGISPLTARAIDRRSKETSANIGQSE